MFSYNTHGETQNQKIRSRYQSYYTRKKKLESERSVIIPMEKHEIRKYDPDPSYYTLKKN